MDNMARQFKKKSIIGSIVPKLTKWGLSTLKLLNNLLAEVINISFCIFYYSNNPIFSEYIC